METKCCKKCNEVKPVNDFNKNQAMCKICQSEYNKQYRKTETGKLNKQKAQKKYDKTSKGKKSFNKYYKKIQGIYEWFDESISLYIGQSSWLTLRINIHKSRLKNPKTSDKTTQAELYKALRQHPNASIRVIEECSQEVLLEREQHYIDTYKPLYNKLV